RLGRQSPLYGMLAAAGMSGVPVIRVVTVVTVNGLPAVLMDGMVTNYSVNQSAAGDPTVSVKGKDMSVLMDVVDMTGRPYPAMSSVMRVVAMLAPYAAFGVVPVPIPA